MSKRHFQHQNGREKPNMVLEKYGFCNGRKVLAEEGAKGKTELSVSSELKHKK